MLTNVILIPLILLGMRILTFILINGILVLVDMLPNHHDRVIALVMVINFMAQILMLYVPLFFMGYLRIIRDRDYGPIVRVF